MSDLIKNYENTIERLFASETWLQDSKYDSWEDVKNNYYKAYNTRENLIKEAEFTQELIRKRVK